MRPLRHDGAGVGRGLGGSDLDGAEKRRVEETQVGGGREAAQEDFEDTAHERIVWRLQQLQLNLGEAGLEGGGWWGGGVVGGGWWVVGGGW